MAKTSFTWSHVAHQPYSFSAKQYAPGRPPYQLQSHEPRVPKHNPLRPTPSFGKNFTNSGSPLPPSLPRFHDDETRQKKISAEEMEYLNDEDGNYFAASSRREAIVKPLLALVITSLPSIATARAENASVGSPKKPPLLEPNNIKEPGSITNGSNDNNKVNSRVYDATVIGEPVALGKERGRVWNKLFGARVVYLGEAENVPDPDDKGIELEIVQNLRDKCYEQKRPISLALQAFPSNLQPQIDQYMSRRINDGELKSFVSHWPAQRWKEYMPLLHYCCENGVRLIACGAPLEIMRIVQSEGVQGLSPVDRRKYAPPAGAGFVANSSSVSRRLSLYNVLPQASFSFGAASYLFAQARVVEDYIMSQIVNQAIVDGGSAGLLIVITGSSHVLLGTRGGGLPARISKKTPKKSQVVVLLNPERQHIRKEGEAPVADFLWYSAAKPCIRNCFDRAEIARIMDAASRRRDTLPQDIQKGLDLGLVSPELLQSFFELEQQPFIADLTHHFQGFRERWLANPRIFQRLALEETICITATLMAQYEKRKERFMEEIDYVISDTLRSAVVSFFAVWLPAPTLSFLSYEENANTSWTIEGLKGLLGSLPENAFQRNSLGQNWDLGARGTAVILGGLKLFCVGFLSSVSTLSVTNILFSIRQQWGTGIEKHNIKVQYPVLKTAFVYGCFLGTSANLRYQFVGGIVEHWVADYLLVSQPLLGDTISFLARVINSYFGTQQWIDLARHVGLQQSKVEPENFEDKVLDTPCAEGSLETSTRAQGLLEKGVVRYLHYGFPYRSFPRMNSGDSFRSKCRTLSNPGRTKVWLSTNFKASHTTFAMASDRDAIESGSLGELEKENQNGALFPDGIESFITEVCDETDIAEIKLKAGSFAMHIRRNIEKSKRPSSVASPLPAPPIPGEPMIDSDPTVTLPSSSPTPKDPPTRSFNPFTAKLSMPKTSKFGLLEAAGDKGLCFVTAPKVGIFKRSRVVKGRIGRPLCEEGQSIKEGQVVCYLDQLGGQTPITSEVSGEVVKILWSEGEPVGYGDPLIAVLPSFHGIK